MADWFQQNAPKPGGDWFAANAPKQEAPPEQPGFLKRVGNAFSESWNALAPEPGKSFDTKASEMVSSLAKAPSQVVEARNRLAAALMSGDHGEVARAAAGKIPLFGAAAESIVKNIQDGDYGSALGHLLGVASQVAPEAAMTAVERLPAKAAQLTESAQRGAAVLKAAGEGAKTSAAQALTGGRVAGAAAAEAVAHAVGLPPAIGTALANAIPIGRAAILAGREAAANLPMSAAEKAAQAARLAEREPAWKLAQVPEVAASSEVQPPMTPPPIETLVAKAQREFAEKLAARKVANAAKVQSEPIQPPQAGTPVQQQNFAPELLDGLSRSLNRGRTFKNLNPLEKQSIIDLAGKLDPQKPEAAPVDAQVPAAATVPAVQAEVQSVAPPAPAVEPPPPQQPAAPRPMPGQPAPIQPPPAAVEYITITGPNGKVSSIAVSKNANGGYLGFDPLNPHKADLHNLQPEKIDLQVGTSDWRKIIEKAGYSPENVIGVVDLNPGSSNPQKIYPGLVYTHPEFRRMGVATEMYNRAMAEMPENTQLQAGSQRPDGKAFRAAYDAKNLAPADTGGRLMIPFPEDTGGWSDGLDVPGPNGEPPLNLPLETHRLAQIAKVNVLTDYLMATDKLREYEALDRSTKAGRAAVNEFEKAARDWGIAQNEQGGRYTFHNENYKATKDVSTRNEIIKKYQNTAFKVHEIMNDPSRYATYKDLRMKGLSEREAVAEMERPKSDVEKFLETIK